MGTEQFRRDFVNEAVNGEPAELVRALVPMDDAQADFQILRLSAVSRLPHLLRTVPPSITQEASRHFDALIERALASIIAGDGATAVGLATPEEVANDPKSAGSTPSWGMKPFVCPTCLSERVGSDSSVVMRTKVQLTSAAKPWFWDTLFHPLPGRTRHLSWNGSPSARWRQRSLAS